MFFDGWSDIVRVLVVGTLAYAALIVLLRVTGKRTLSKMNAFDFVVTVALGSTLATILLSRDVALVEGVVALALLIVLQMVVAWASVRWRGFRRLVKAEPTLLLHKGEMLENAMAHERVVPEEILAAARSSGHADLESLEAVVLETDGTFSVIGKAERGRGTLENVGGP